MRHRWRHLFFNHMDAWGTAMMVAVVAVLLHQSLTGRAVMLIIALAAGYWLAFALNDYFDVPYDALEPDKARTNFFVPVQSGRPALLLVFGLLTLGLSAVFFSFGLRGVLLLAVAYLVMWAYSAPPLRIKKRPGWDLLVHALFVQSFPYLIVMLLLRLPWRGQDTALMLVLFLASLAAQLEQQARDYALDARTEGNFATYVGYPATVRYLRLVTVMLVLVGAAAVAAGAVPLFLVVFGLIGLPALLHRLLRRPDQPRSERLVRYSIMAALGYTGLVLAYWLLRRVL